MTAHVLSNPAWNSLAGLHACYASGTQAARRYARGYSPIFGFADPDHADFQEVAPYCSVGERLYCVGWSGAAPADWQVDIDTRAQQMLWVGDVPELDDALGAVRLGKAHVPQVMALVEATKPGPFAERTVEMGEYYGVFVGDRLVAMAGERLGTSDYREISGVCTHPDFQSQGLARRLVRMLVRIELARGQTPFLHVLDYNHHARRIYERMGFRKREEIVFRLLSRTS